MSHIAYNSLVFEIGRQLDQHDRRQLLHMCKLEDEADDIPDAISLLKRLEEKNQLTIDRLGDLEDVLESLEEFSLLGKLKNFEIKRKEYNNLLAQISRALDGDERNHLEQLINICRREPSLELEENIPNVRTLFKKLEKRGYLGFRSLDLLKEILTEIERQDLVKGVEDFEERRNKKDKSERRKAKLYSWVKTGARKVKGVSLKTACKVGRRVLHFTDILANWGSFSQFLRSFTERVLPADTELANVREGCVCFTVQTNNIKGLTTLWNMYQDGTLKARLYDFLVTDEMKHLADGEENVELTVTIEKEEYEKACVDIIDEAIGNGKQPRGRKRRYSDSVLSDIPKEDETPPVKLKRLENEVQLLKERIESQEREMVKLPLEVLETGGAMDVVSVEQAHYFGYEGLESFSEDKWDSTKRYVDNLQLETLSSTTETTDSGMGTLGAPSELGEDIAGKSETQSVTGDEWKSLHMAARTDNVAIIETILSRGVDINLKDSNCYTPLIIAASYGKSKAVHYLLDKGADPSVKGRFGRNLLQIASEGGNVAIIETMLSRGLDINSKDSDGNTPLIIAALFGKSEAVHYLLDKGADPSVKGQFGRNLLHAASLGGNVAIIEKMLSLGLDINSKDMNEDTPLIIAAVFGKSEAVHYLLDKGADPSVKGRFGINLLQAASLGGNVAIIETMLSLGLDINSKDMNEDTPLIIAAGYGKSEAVHYLLDRGADPSVKGRLGRNSLHATSEGGNVAIIETILSRGLDINLKDEYGKTPLMRAKDKGKN